MTEEQALTHTVDRTGWPAGPWDSEPDRVDFEHSGFACMLLRNRVGNWCGYVGVGPDHPMHGKGYDDVDVQVHGGLTYADKCQGHICHVPKPGMPSDVWWRGFDCGHSGDVSPDMLAFQMKHDDLRMPFGYETYKDMAYVRKEVESLAEQLSII